MADIFPESREEEILVSMIDGEEYNKAPESRIEALLLELKEVIEEGGGGGGGTITYLDNGKVGQASPAVYVNVPLDVPMVPGMFKVTLKDNGEEETRYINWSGSETFSFSGGKDLLITDTTAGLTHYDGSYRDIYCDIVSVGNSNNYNDLTNKPSINDITLSGNKTSADLGIPTASDLAGKQDVLPVTASGNNVTFNGDIQDGQGNTLSVLAEALTKTASGNPVVISDCAGGKARSLKTTINAIQDLHGLPFPYVGGAYKNKLNYDVWKTVGIIGGSATWENNGVTLTATANDCYTRFLENDYPVEARIPITNGQKITVSWKETTNKHGIVAIFPNASMTGLVTVDNANAKQLTYTAKSGDTFITFRFGVTNSGDTISYKDIQFEYGDTATSFAPYSNLCPISGRTAVAVDVDGNLASPEFEQGGINGPIVPAVPYSNQKISMSTRIRTKNLIYLPVDTEFTVDCDSSIYDFVAQSYDADGLCVVTAYPYNLWTSERTVYKSKGSFAIAIRHKDNSDISVSELSNVHLRICLTHTTATIQLGTTVYGADINWDTGVGSVLNAMIALNSKSWGGNNGSFYTSNPVADIKCNDGRYDHCISDRFMYENQPTLARLSDGGMSVDNSGYIQIKCSAYSTASDFVAAMGDAQILYELATPTTIQLTPTQLELLKGYNRVTVESGTITLDYIAKAISGNDEEIAPLVGDKATKSYAVNDFIERADGLYRVTAPIASGASFTANNTVKMSIGEALTYLYNK